jgi:hypothetical protein
LLGFGMVKMGIDPREAKVENLTVKIHHRGFDT